MRPSRASSNGQHLQLILPPTLCPYLHTCPTTRASLQIQLAPLLVGLPVPASTTKCVMRVHLQRQRQRRVAAFALTCRTLQIMPRSNQPKDHHQCPLAPPLPLHHNKLQHNDEPRTGHNDVELGPVRLQGRR